MSSIVVVDTSIVIKWIIKESDSDIAMALLADWTNTAVAVIAPAILAYEVTNALYQRVRREEITILQAQQLLSTVFLSDITILFSQSQHISTRAIELAHRFRLPATYDAQYLALAESQGCELWTADTKMWRAVKEQIPWVHHMNDYHIS